MDIKSIIIPLVIGTLGMIQKGTENDVKKNSCLHQHHRATNLYFVWNCIYPQNLLNEKSKMCKDSSLTVPFYS